MFLLLDPNEFAHDISIKLKIQWDDMYGNMESEKFKTLRDQIVESVSLFVLNHILYFQRMKWCVFTINYGGICKLLFEPGESGCSSIQDECLITYMNTCCNLNIPLY